MGEARSAIHNGYLTGFVPQAQEDRWQAHQVCKKRKFELGRPPSMTKIGETRIHSVRTRGGNKKYRALRLNYGNFSWPSESVTKKCRILNVVYNASNNELVRTNTLVKG